mmetsp:Transcript_6616/g.13538  ORF Transcript_6616/g.13538 Transcript_6616/m.13538 type:complete len:524 (-) Transcript_6616:61-1632(-)
MAVTGRNGMGPDGGVSLEIPQAATATVHTVTADVHITPGADERALPRGEANSEADAFMLRSGQRGTSSGRGAGGAGGAGAGEGDGQQPQKTRSSRSSFIAHQKLKAAKSVTLDSPMRKAKNMCKSSSLLRLDLHLPEPDKLKKLEQEGDLDVTIRPTIAVATKRETLQDYFSSLDDDGSGEVELDEMLAWLPKIGMGSQAQQDQVRDHFRFMDRDGSGQVDFEEFAEATIDVADHDATSLADEKYIKHFGMEIYMFLASLKRYKLIEAYENSLKDRDDQLAPFLKFEQLMKISQAATMPLEMIRQQTPPPDPGLIKAQKDGRLGHIKETKKSNDPDTLSMMSPGQRAEQDASAKKKKRMKINKKRASICAKVAAKRSHSYDRWQPAALTKKKHYNADKSDRRDARLSYVNKQDRDFDDSIEALMRRSRHDHKHEFLLGLGGASRGGLSASGGVGGFGGARSDRGGGDGISITSALSAQTFGYTNTALNTELNSIEGRLSGDGRAGFGRRAGAGGRDAGRLPRA